MILYWPSWKGAAGAYAKLHHIPIPHGFNPDTNVYGPSALALVKAVQQDFRLTPDGVVGPMTRSVLRRYVSPFDMHAGMTYFGHRGATDQAAIHYDQVRPILHEYRLPMVTDCSGWDTLCCELTGAPDPSNFNFNGVGNTTTILANATPITRSELSPGCHVLFSNPDHVVFVVQPGSDPLVSSHGFEGGPILIPLSVEARYHRSIAGYRALRHL